MKLCAVSSRVERASSIVELVHQHARDAGDQPAVIFVSDPAEEVAETLTYAGLDRDARRLAVVLRERLSTGDRVLLPLTTGLGFARGFLGCLYAGMVGVPAPPPDDGKHRSRRLAGIARDADVSAVITDAAELPAVSTWAGAVGLDRAWCLAADGDDGVGDPDTWTIPTIGRDSLALLQYTSGSTSEPKGVMVTNENLLHNADTMGQAMGRPAAVRFGGWGPLFHDMGLAMLLKPLILAGTSVLMTPTSFLKRPHSWLRMIDRFDVSFSPAPNFAYDLCTRQVTDEQVAELDLSRWDYAANGSEPVDAGTLDRFAHRFAPAGLRASALCPVYGLAEATVYVSGVSLNPPVRSRLGGSRDRVSCGVPAEFDVRIVDPAGGEVVPDGREGEIWLRGPSVAAGYWRRDAPSFAAVTADGDAGYLRTGDLGVRSDGELFVTGRLKDLIIVHGRNLYPQDLEHEARLLADELASVVGAAFEVDDRIVLVHEVRGRPDRARLAEIAAEVSRSIATVFGVTVGGVVLVRKGTVLRTTSGKVRRAAMRERFLAGAVDPLYERVDPSLLRAWLAGRVAAYVDLAPEQIDPDETLAALGLSSVYALIVCGEIEDRFSITVDETMVVDYPTINAIVGYLTAARAAT